MATRFRRERFLFPLDIRQPEGRVAARPVDAFTRPSQGPIIQAPQRPFEIPRPDRSNSLIDLARSLGVAGENLTQISDRQAEAFNEQAIAEGARLATEDELAGNRQNWKQLISKTRIDSGEDAARELMGMNPHVQRGFDQARARSAALTYNAAIQNAFSTNPVLDEEAGLRLHDVDVSHPLYTAWLENFTAEFNTANGIAGIDPRVLPTVLPAQQDARNRVNIAQAELRGEIKLRDYEDATAEFINTVVFDLNSNSEWQRGFDNDALSGTAEMITLQIDQANSLGFGGADLDTVIATTVEQIISAAITTNNPALLELIELIEVGPRDSRRLLTDTKAGSRYRDAVTSAKRTIVDREFQLSQRERQVRDQNRVDSQNEGLELIAQAAGIYENTGRTLEARQALENIISDVRTDAAENGWSTQLNNLVGKVVQESVDNQGLNVVDYAAISAFETAVRTGNLTGAAARARANDMLLSGDFGNNQQSYETYLRLTATITDTDNRVQAATTAELDRAADEVGKVITARLGFTEDERGRLENIHQTLNAANFTDDQIRAVMGYTPEQLETYLRANEGGLTEPVIQALSLIVTQGLNPFNLPQAFDPATVIREETLFKNEVFDGIRAFEEREGRPMTPAERQQFLNDSVTSYLAGQTFQLPQSNPLSSIREPNDEIGRYREQIYSQVFEGLADTTLNASTQIVMDELQLIKGLEYFAETGTWHPEITELARVNGLTPMALIQSQSAQHGTQIDSSFLNTIGVSTPATPSDAEFGTSAYTSNRDITRDYAPGSYSLFTGNLVDDTPEGSYDFTLIQNDRTDVNVPAPFDGVVTEVWTESTSGGYGNGVVIQERGTNRRLFIAHAAEVYLNRGDRFRRGQAILKQGSTGNSSADHLHVEVLDSNGVIIANRSQTRPIIEEWFDLITQSQFTQSTQGSGAWSPTLLPELTRAIEGTASRVGVRPDELASVLALESSLDINAQGGDGDNYIGLWQAGPEERSVYGVYRGMPATQQMAALERFLKDRGFQPGMGIERLYSTILAGNPNAANSFDSNNVSAASVSAQFQPGGEFHNRARTILGF